MAALLGKALISRAKWLAAVIILVLVPAALAGVDSGPILDRWFAAQANLKTWQADFVQTRSLKTLTRPLVAQGRVWFEAPGSFRWELGQPAKTVALRRGDEMYVIYPKLKRAERYALGAAMPAQWREVMSLLDSGFPKSRQELEAQFKVAGADQNENRWDLTLQPRSSFARQIMPEFHLGLSTNDFALVRTEMVFADGSVLKNEFSAITINGTVSEETFSWKPPADFKVTEPLAK